MMRPRPAVALLSVLMAVLCVPAGAQTNGRSKAPTHRDTQASIPVDLAKQVREARLAGVKAFTVSGSQQFLPTTWCGAERTTDDVDDAAQLSDDAVIKVVYVYASDQPDRFDTWKNALQADVSLIGQFMSQQDGATKSPRFDMGTSCGPQYLDVQTVALPQPRSYYIDQFDRIDAAVGAAIGSTPVKRDIITLADGLTTTTGGFYGLGQHYIDSIAEVAGPSNIHNGGNLYAALFPPNGYSPGSSFWPEGMLHEITHMLGAVNSGAPHATSQGHCTDGYDVMCYADGGTSSVPYSTSACPSIGGVSGMTQTYDCGRDDYFSPNPAPGSYLATHWNVYDSVFEAPCATSGLVCGADATAPPAAVGAPQVTGTRKVMYTLTADHGTWSGNPTSYAYQWQRITGANPPADIAGATDPSYTLVAGDASTQVQVEVTATNANGSATNTSAPASITAFNPPVNTAPPSVSGTARRLERAERDDRHVDRRCEQEPQVAAARRRDVDRHRRPGRLDLHAGVGRRGQVGARARDSDERRRPRQHAVQRDRARAGPAAHAGHGAARQRHRAAHEVPRGLDRHLDRGADVLRLPMAARRRRRLRRHPRRDRLVLRPRRR